MNEDLQEVKKKRGAAGPARYPASLGQPADQRALTCSNPREDPSRNDNL
jgi:hypothetical protein